tara:strand:+ start:239 stop:967 length:729 start_codon:yes stop_codon:yes gene_type:complete
MVTYFKFIFLIFVFVGCSNVLIAEQYNVTTFSQQLIEYEVSKKLKNQFKAIEGLDIDVTVTQSDLFKNVPPDALYVYVDYAKPDTYLGKLLLDISFLTENNELIVEKKCLVESKVFGNVYVASQKLQKSHKISADDLELKRVQITDLYQAILFNKEAILGKQTTKKMAKGLVFSEKWVEIQPDILKGETVKVLVSSVGFDLKYDAVALQSGMIGDVIQLKTMNKKIINGEITNDKMVFINLN